MWSNILLPVNVSIEQLVAEPAAAADNDNDNDDNDDDVYTVIQSAGIQCGELSMMLCLPDEILLAIFTYLPQRDVASCALVCRKFYRVAMDSTLCE